MRSQNHAYSQPTNLYSVISILLVVTLLTPALIIMPELAAPAKAQPALMELATQQPDIRVGVIVQKIAKDHRVEDLVIQLGGRIIKDLRIINAFAAEMKAGAVPELAQSPGVRWVSLDAPMVRSALTTETVRDTFNTPSYSNHDGTQKWAGDWTEAGDDGTPDGGDVKITRGRLRIKNNHRAISRQVDLSSATSAVLSFEYRRSGMDKPADYVVLEISADGGTSWTELSRFAGPDNDSQFQPASFDIAGYLTHHTTLRFSTSPSLGSQDKLYVDNLQIKYNIGEGDKTDKGGGRQFHVRDEFNTNRFNENDGLTPWKTDWVENDAVSPIQNASKGDVRVVSGKLRLSNQSFATKEPAVTRAVDLSGGVTHATLNFTYQTSPGVDPNDTISVDISNDDGLTWVVLDTVENLQGASAGSRRYDITPFATPYTQIRFRVTDSYENPDEYFDIDNVEVVYTRDNGWNPILDVQSVADDFEPVPHTYSNNSGTRDWTGPWQEVGDDDSPSGDIGMINYEGSSRLRIWTSAQDNGWEPTRGIWRTADLTEATEATLSFVYSRSSMEADDYLAVEASADGGATWTEIGRIEGRRGPASIITDNGWRYARYDLSDFISVNTAIRFISAFAQSDDSDTLYLDDITITYNRPLGVLPPNHYLGTLNVPPVWDMGLMGEGVTVAVVDSGIALSYDFGSAQGSPDHQRVVLQRGFNPTSNVVGDAYGHGTHVAGIIAGNGTQSAGFYQGIAPMASLIGLKVSDDNGMAYESDTVAALQWIYENKDAYNIRVVNMSINSTVEDSYHNSPLDAAAEILWFNGIVVVVSAGNSGGSTEYNTANAAPANDPFVITVGASQENGTPNLYDDSLAPFSAAAITQDGFVKPDIIAPGKDIISVLARSSWWRNDYPDRVVQGRYFRISGTSMSAPMVAGAIALLLQNEPNLTPNQVKYRLLNTANTISGESGTYPYLNVLGAVTGTTIESANTGTMPHLLLAKMALIAFWASDNGGDAINWDSVNWDSVNWDSVNWDLVNWDSVNWDSVNWDSVNWDSVNWDSVNWDSVNWNSVNWDSVNWNSVNWDSVNWNSVNWSNE